MDDMTKKDKLEDWKIYRGDGKPDPARLAKLPEPPPWRSFERLNETRAKTFQPPAGVVEAVNAALYLRRPLLVTGDPGTGKSSLAYAVARELELGAVLSWPINSRSILTEGLYQYDALARLREASLGRARREPGESEILAPKEDIGLYIKLGPLGTAFRARRHPRVVLIDEIDKSDIDLPNDLLHVLENGEFEIPELVRIADTTPIVKISVSGTGRTGRRVEIRRGRVRCRKFPFIVITSNGERDLPPAFLRRCLRLDLPVPTAEQLQKIVQEHLPDEDQTRLKALLDRFVDKRNQGVMLATDQLLNAFFLANRGKGMSAAERDLLESILLRELDAR
jgi:MoxR-like ATPase